MRNGWRPALLGILGMAIYMIAGSVLGTPNAAIAITTTAQWVIVPEQSRVLLDYERDGQWAEGEFARFEGTGAFDPGAPNDANLDLRVESASIDLNDNLANALMTSAEWFDCDNFPLMTYRLMSLTPEGGNNYRAVGEVSIRGRTQPIETTVIVEIGSGDIEISGTLNLNRKDFRLGTGFSSLFLDIGREVAVRFELTARPLS